MILSQLVSFLSMIPLALKPYNSSGTVNLMLNYLKSGSANHLLYIFLTRK